MKILSIRLKNINSLRGEWFIDFTAEPFASNGLFAITGPTGAGKSTLLDAVCLALYHQTPRLKEPSPAEKVMTRHTHVCMCEIEFSVKDNSVYRAFWEVRRARAQATGKLQPPKVELVLVGGGEDGKDKILADKLRDKLELTAELTGLDFSRFTKSMLLAQGGFAAFLNANSGDRAELLEELTGTDIYGRISSEVFERYRQEKEKQNLLKARLEGFERMEPEKLAELREENQALESQRLETQKHLDEIRATLSLLEKVEQSKAVVKRCDEALADHLLYQESQKTQLSALDRAIPAQEIFGDYKRCQETLGAITQLRDERTCLTEAIRVKEKGFEESRAASQQAAAFLESCRVEHTELETFLVETLAPLDQKIQGLSDSIREGNVALQKQSKLKEVEQTKVSSAKQKLETLSKRVTEIEAWLGDNAWLSTASQQLGGIQNFLQQLSSANQDLTQAKAALNKEFEQQRAQQSALAAMNAELKQLEDEFGKHKAVTENQLQHKVAFLGAQEVGELEESFQNLDLRRNAVSECKKLNELAQTLAASRQTLQQEWDKSTLSVAALETEIQGLRTSYQHANNHLQTLKDKAELEAQIQSLSQHREKLKEGEACPLCGSTEHPALESYANFGLSQTKQALLEQEKSVELLKTQGLEKKEQLIQLNAEIEGLKVRLADLDIQASSTQSSWQQYAANLECTLSPLDAKVPSFLDQALRTLEALEHKEQEWRALNEAISACQEAQADAQARLEKRQYDKQNLENSLTFIAQACQEKQQRLDALQSRVAEIEAQLKKLVLSVSNKEIDLDLIADWVASTRQQCEQFSIQQVARQESSEQAGELEKQLASYQSALEALISQEKETEKRLSALGEELKGATDKRASLFGDKDIKQARESSSKRLEDADLAAQKKQSAVSETERELSSLRGKLEQLAMQLEQQTELHAQLSEIWLRVLAESPFHDEQAFLTACIDQAELKRLQALKEALDTKRLSLEAELSAGKKALKELQELQDHDGREVVIADVRSQLANTEAKVQELDQKQGELKQVLKAEDELGSKYQSLIAEIEAQQQTYDDWSHLNSLIGSKDGKRFRVFAQGLTLDYLIQLANRRLESLHARYHLIRSDNQGLELQVMDKWQADAVRDTRTLSGGESFLVSLALALALSDLVSYKTQIDSLFLDEGFGTLDRATLDIALDSLDQLNSQGKMVGVISHIDALKERIPIQIEIKKMSGLGYSRLDKSYEV